MENHITGYPLLLQPLSSQIKAHGGEGIPWSAVEPVANSFSVIYTFNTDEGQKRLTTPNEFQFCLIDDVKNYHGYYLADKGLYVLRSKAQSNKPDSKPFLETVPLGTTFDDAKKELQRLFPKRLTWKLEDPLLALK